LPDLQLRVSGKENLGDKDFVRSEIARRDGFVVFGMLLRVNQHRGRSFRDGVIVGPFRQDISHGIPQINLDPLVRRKFEGNWTLGQIRQCHFDLELADFR